MADDINLPNLISHLAVNLDGVSGAVADASRQGSAMGSALGNGIHRQLDDLLRNLPQVQIDGDSEPLDRDLARVHQQLARLDAQRIGVDISIPDALRNLDTLETHLRRIGDEHPDINVRASTRQAAARLEELRAAARRVDDTDVDIDVDVHEDRVNRLNGLLGKLGRMAGPIAGVAGSFGKLAAGVGAVVPAAASVVTTLANVAPAAGVAVTGLLAVQLASGAVKLAMSGVQDSLTAALDPSKAEEFNASLEKLSPSARAFAEEVHGLAPDLHEMQQAVQQEAFQGLDKTLARTATATLPILRTNLVGAAGAVRDMAKGGLEAARDLGESGVLGRALGSARKGLQNLSGVPGVVVTALGQIGAAAGPTFDRLTSGAAKAASGIGDKLSGAFESGAMQDAIDHAVDLLGQLAGVGGNVGKILGSVFAAVPPGGGGLIGILSDVTGAIAGIAASDGVQDGLKALFETMGTLGATAAPLLASALTAVAPVLTALGPPVQSLIENLGDGLSPIIDALGPVLEVAAGAVGTLVEAVAPLLPVAGQLVASLLPALTPLLEAAQVVFAAMAPVVLQVATILQDSLAPIIADLPAIVTPLAELLAGVLVIGLQLLGDTLTAVAPSLTQLGLTAGELLIACAPLIEAVAQLTVGLLQGLMPVLEPIIGLVGRLAGVLADRLASVVTTVVVPAVQFISALLRGDFSGAMDIAKKAALTMVAKTVETFSGLPGKAKAALGSLATALGNRMLEAVARVQSAAQGGIRTAVATLGSLPGKARAAIGNMSGVLLSAGKSLIAGFVAGIVSRFGQVKSTLGNLTSNLTDWKGPPKKDAKILTPAGKLLIEGFIKGIDGTTAKLRSRLESITKALPANVKSGYGKTLAKATRELEGLVTSRDKVIKRLATAQKKLDDLMTSRDKAANDITSGILSEANITSGHSDVNSITAITVGLQQALKKTKEFQANIAKLKKAGLRADLLQQVADAGVEGGSATAAALAKATPAELKKINDLQGKLETAAGATGNAVGDALYGAGVRAAQGLVDGLKSQQASIEKTMDKIAEGMLKTVKKKHKTHSPSLAFHEIGAMDMEGWRGGVLARAHRVIGAAADVAGSMLGAASAAGGVFTGTPSAGQLAAVYAGSGSSSQTNNFHMYGSDASPGGILRALSWQGLVGRK